MHARPQTRKRDEADRPKFFQLNNFLHFCILPTFLLPHNATTHARQHLLRKALTTHKPRGHYEPARLASSRFSRPVYMSDATVARRPP
jgi:hypothetical protein